MDPGSGLTRVRVVVIDDDPEMQNLLEVEFEEAPDIEIVARGQNGREAIQLANRYRPDVMVLDIHMPMLDGLEAGARIARAFPNIGLVILSADQSLERIKQAHLRCRALAFLEKTPAELLRLAEVIREASRTRDQQSPMRGIAAFWSFHSPVGRAGSTAMAVNSAFELATLGYRTLLVDLGTMHGSCGFELGLEEGVPGSRSLLAELRDLETLDESTLKSFIARPPRSEERPVVDLICSPCTYIAESFELGQKLKRCFEIWEECYDYVILDVPSGQLINELNVQAVEFSERIFLCCHRDTKGIKGFNDLLRLLREVSFTPDRLTLLFSGVPGSHARDPRTWLEKRQIRFKSLHELPWDPEAVDLSLARGRPVITEQPDSELSRMIRKIVIEALNFPPVEREASGLWQRVLRVIGR